MPRRAISVINIASLISRWPWPFFDDLLCRYHYRPPSISEIAAAFRRFSKCHINSTSWLTLAGHRSSQHIMPRLQRDASPSAFASLAIIDLPAPADYQVAAGEPKATRRLTKRKPMFHARDSAAADAEHDISTKCHIVACGGAALSPPGRQLRGGAIIKHDDMRRSHHAIMYTRWHCCSSRPSGAK